MPTATPSATLLPVGELVGGKVAYVAAGLGDVQSVIAGIITTLTNGGSAADHPPLEHRCAVSGGTSRDCTLMGTGASKTIHLVLGADNCETSGLWGGTAAFNGTITIDSNAFFTNTCGPPPAFTSASYIVEGPPDQPQQGFTTLLRDGMTNEKENIVVSPLSGTVSLAPAPGTACLINGITLTLNGSLTAQRADGSESGADFSDATAVMDQIIFNANCVPIFYRLKFSGEVRWRVRFPGDDIGRGFTATLSNFFLTQDATGTRTLTDLSGELPSTDCFGSITLQPSTSLSVPPGALCPLTGQFTASASGAMAMVTYEDGQVVVEQAGGQQVYADCRAEDLQMCLPQ